jgi:diguanylate cyclase (GGDEF)-like protein
VLTARGCRARPFTETKPFLNVASPRASYIRYAVGQWKKGQRATWVLGVVLGFVAGGAVVAAAGLVLPGVLDPHRERIGILAWLGLMLLVAGVSGLAVVSTTRRLRRQARRTTAIAIAAQRVGLAIDVNEVAGAVLVAAREVFPEADFGGVLLFDRASEKLKPLPMSMQAGVVEARAAGKVIDLSPGEGVAGKVFLAAEARCWGSPEEVLAEHGNMRTSTREQILALTGGMKSVAAAPLKLVDQGVIGVLTLGSSSRERVFVDPDLVVLQGLAEQAALGVERARMYQVQRDQAMTDPLTGLANYRALKNVVNQEVARARRTSGRLALLFCDLDGFKAVNDLHGHRVGDAVLRLLSRAMGDVLRTEDLAARYGGDEFVCVLPGADLVQAQQVTDRIGQRFVQMLAEEHELEHVRTFPSAGCAIFPEQGQTADDLLAAADASLLRAKRAVPESERRRAAQG